MNSLKDGWFSEVDKVLWPGQCFSLQCDKLLYEGKSKYQDILVFNSDLIFRYFVSKSLLKVIFKLIYQVFHK